MPVWHFWGPGLFQVSPLLTCLPISGCMGFAVRRWRWFDLFFGLGAWFVIVLYSCASVGSWSNLCCLLSNHVLFKEGSFALLLALNFCFCMFPWWLLNRLELWQAAGWGRNTLVPAEWDLCSAGEPCQIQGPCTAHRQARKYVFCIHHETLILLHPGPVIV